MLKNKSLISTNDLTNEELLEIIEYAQDILKSPNDFSHIADGKLLGTLFFEPSTRTKLSFESAMKRLGGKVVGFSGTQNNSTAKGECLTDTVKTVSQYTDVIAMRHPNEGSAKLASEFADVPIINAGDGGHQHPTQTLTDLLTITEEKKRLTDMKIGLCGDLKYGRTVHSLIATLSRFPGNEFILISPDELKIPSYIREQVLMANNIKFREVQTMEEVMDELDILYMTRVQRERFSSYTDYERLKDTYILDLDKLENAKKDLAILHPLPRVNEIAKEVDQDPRALYFKQAKYGMYVRMSLLAKIMGVHKDGKHK